MGSCRSFIRLRRIICFCNLRHHRIWKKYQLWRLVQLEEKKEGCRQWTLTINHNKGQERAIKNLAMTTKKRKSHRHKTLELYTMLRNVEWNCLLLFSLCIIMSIYTLYNWLYIKARKIEYNKLKYFTPFILKLNPCIKKFFISRDLHDSFFFSYKIRNYLKIVVNCPILVITKNT